MGKALVRCCSATKIWTVSLKLWRRKKMRFPDQSESQVSKRTQIAIEPKMERMFLLPAGFAGCSLPSPPELVGKDAVCVCVCLFAFGFSIIKSLFICSLRVLFASCAERDKLVQFFPPSADYRQFCFVTFTFASFLNTLKHFLYLSYFFVAIISCNLLLLNFPRAWSFNARHTFSPFFVTILLLLPLQECVWVVGCVCDCECCCCFLYSSVLAGGCCFVLCLLRTVKRINLCLFFVVTYWLFWIRLLFLQCWWFYRIVLKFFFLVCIFLSFSPSFNVVVLIIFTPFLLPPLLLSGLV